MYVIIDNYDSFTHNLYQYLRELTDVPVEVLPQRPDHRGRARGDEARRASSSPRDRDGPRRRASAWSSSGGSPARCPSWASAWATRPSRPPSAGRIVPARRIVHGKAEDMQPGRPGAVPRPAADGEVHPLPFAGRRSGNRFPRSWKSPRSRADGEIMGVRHRELVIEGIQFHPESIASEHGKRVPAELPQLPARALPPVHHPRGPAERQADEPRGRRALHGRAHRRPAHRRADRRRPGVHDRAADHAPGARRVRHRAAAEEEAVCQRPPGPGHLRDRRRRPLHLQHLVPGGGGGRLLRGARGKARQPRGQLSRGQRRLLPRAGRRRGRAPARGGGACCARRDSASSSPRSTTAPCATPPGRAASWGSGAR